MTCPFFYVFPVHGYPLGVSRVVLLPLGLPILFDVGAPGGRGGFRGRVSQSLVFGEVHSKFVHQMRVLVQQCSVWGLGLELVMLLSQVSSLDSHTLVTLTRLQEARLCLAGRA